jgi:hypothetical protein
VLSIQCNVTLLVYRFLCQVELNLKRSCQHFAVQCEPNIPGLCMMLPSVNEWLNYRTSFIDWFQPHMIVHDHCHKMWCVHGTSMYVWSYFPQVDHVFRITTTECRMIWRQFIQWMHACTDHNYWLMTWKGIIKHCIGGRGNLHQKGSIRLHIILSWSVLTCTGSVFKSSLSLMFVFANHRVVIESVISHAGNVEYTLASTLAGCVCSFKFTKDYFKPAPCV